MVKALGNPADAAPCLNASRKDEDPRVFLMTLRDVAEAHRGIGAPAVLNSLGIMAVQSIAPGGRCKPRVA
jgi:hypothetical protein